MALGILLFFILQIILCIGIFVFGALASAVPVIEYNYFALTQNILIGILILSWVIVYIILSWLNSKKK